MSERSSPKTVPGLQAMKQASEPIAMLTAYDASFARLLDAAGVDCVLVGDSLGNVIQGRDSTLPVSVGDMVYHVSAVRRGLANALLIGDLPFLSYHDRAAAMDSAGRLMRAGAQMVKLEGGAPVVDVVAALIRQGIPVCAHLGLTPQHVHRLGGYRVQGREADVAEQLRDDAHALQQAGAAMLVLECVPSALAAEIAAALAIPVIGIGAGRRVDGQVLVLYDALGLSGAATPRFVHDFMADAGDVPGALAAYVEAVRQGRFPGPGHEYD